MDRDLAERMLHELALIAQILDAQNKVLRAILERLPPATYPRPTGAILTIRS
jgi:hypothetical protein